MKTLPTLTWSDFDQHNPCYSPQEKYGDFTGTILDILKDERIPNEDKIWASTCKGILPDYVNRKFATQCCRQIWHLLTDERSRNAVEVAERFNEGEATQEELDAAWAAAWAATRATRATRDAQVKLMIEIIETHYACEKAIKEGSND